MYRQIISKYGHHHIVRKQMLQSEQLTLRLANHGDYHHMLKLSKEGQPEHEAATDYIPAKYHWLLNTGNTIPCLVLADQKPVLCAFYYLLTKNTEALGMAARTLPHYQNKGLFHFMGKNMEEFLIKEIPTIQRWLTIGAETSGRKKMIDYIGGVRREITWDMLTYNLQQCGENIMMTPLQNEVNEVSIDEIEELFSNPKSTNYDVFKGDRLAAEKPKIPYIVNLENILYLANKNIVFVTNIENSNIINAITFASIIQVHSGLLYEIFYYGIADIDILHKHVLTTLRRLHGQASITETTNVNFSLYLPNGFNLTAVEDMLKENKMGTKVKSSFFSMFEYSMEIWNLKSKI